MAAIRTLCSIAIALSLCVLLGCGADVDSRPSVVLVVVDTLRADAVSAYSEGGDRRGREHEGAARSATPVIDALAARGVRYRHAFSAAPWTLPSHASLFTGVGMDRHHVGTPGRLVLPDAAVTVAERLRDAGYETAAFSENMLVSDVFHQLQGFEYRQTNRVIHKGPDVPLDVYLEIDLVHEVQRWLEARDPARPFFLFVNVFDAHNPYSVRDENPWVPKGVSVPSMRLYAENPQQHLCDALPTPDEIEVLHGLYLGDVAAADRKVGAVFDAIRAHVGDRPVIRILTSDHGELFGERRLLGHEFNVSQAALHVPLVVAGLPGVRPAVVDRPVSLLDVVPSILAWTGQAPDPGLEGSPLPLVPATAPPTAKRTLIAGYSDAFTLAPDEWKGLILFGSKDVPRKECGEEDKVFGGMVSVTRYPFKLLWYERYAPELYDLRFDAGERSNLAEYRPNLAAELLAEAEGFAREAQLVGAPRRAPSPGEAPPDPGAAKALKALGYVD